MKNENPVEEIWRIRDELGAAEGYDVHRLFERLRREEKKHAARLVHYVPRRPTGESAAMLREERPRTD
jgi:hypothetical protein